MQSEIRTTPVLNKKAFENRAVGKEFSLSEIALLNVFSQENAFSRGPKVSGLLNLCSTSGAATDATREEFQKGIKKC